MAKTFPIRGSGGLPVIVNEATARTYPVRDVLMNDTTPPPTPPATGGTVVVFVAT